MSWSVARVWVAGCAGVFGFLFGLGKLVMGEPLSAIPLLVLAVAGGWVIARELKR